MLSDSCNSWWKYTRWKAGRGKLSKIWLNLSSGTIAALNEHSPSSAFKYAIEKSLLALPIFPRLRCLCCQISHVDLQSKTRFVLWRQRLVAYCWFADGNVHFMWCTFGKIVFVVLYNFSETVHFTKFFV